MLPHPEGSSGNSFCFADNEVCQLKSGQVCETGRAVVDMAYLVLL